MVKANYACVDTYPTNEADEEAVRTFKRWLPGEFSHRVQLPRSFSERTVSIWTNSITLKYRGQEFLRKSDKSNLQGLQTQNMTWFEPPPPRKSEKPVHTCCINFSWTFEFLFFHEISSGTHCPDDTHSTNYRPRGCLTDFVTSSFNCSCSTPTHKFVPNHLTVQCVRQTPTSHFPTRPTTGPMTRDNFPLHALHVKYPSLHTLTL